MGKRGRSSPHPATGIVSRAPLALAGLLALLLAGCGAGGSDQPKLAKHQIFTWAYVNATAVESPHMDVAVLDPAVIANAIDLSNVAMLYSGLVTLNSSTLQVEPDAASSWDSSPDGKEYTFHLRPNLFFSDGTPITAANFAYSIDRAIAPNATVCTLDDSQTYGQSPGCLALGGSYLSLILGAETKLSLSPHDAAHDSLIGAGKGLEVVDSKTLIIRIVHPAAYFLEALDYPTSYPVEQSLIQKYHGGTWVDHLNAGGCSGPFMVKSYTPGQDLQMVPNPYWERAWGKTLTLTEVDRPFLRSQDTEYHAYDTLGSYDYTDVPADDYTFALGQGDFHEIPSLTTDYFGLNFNEPPFNNLQVRQAFDLALNKQLLVDRVWSGGAIPTNHIVPEGNPGFNPQLTGPDGTQADTGNQLKAIQLLQDAQNTCNANANAAGILPTYCPYIDNGSNSTPIYLSAGVITDASQQEIATIATQTWSQVLHLKVQIKPYTDLNALEGELFPALPATNTAQLWQIGWLADFPDPEDWLSLQFSTGAPNNISYVDDPHLDELMTQADGEQNPVQRMDEYHTIEQDVVDQVAWIPYAQEKAAWRLRPWVQGFGLNQVLIMEDVDWPSVSILAH